MPFYNVLWPVRTAMGIETTSSVGENSKSAQEESTSDSEENGRNKDETSRKKTKRKKLQPLNGQKYEEIKAFMPTRTNENDSVRLYSGNKPPTLNQHKHLDILCRSARRFQQQSEATTPQPESYDSIDGFVGGDFASGQIRSIKLPSGCWIMKFSPQADLLAVGLLNQVDFIETTNYTTTYSLPFAGKVSAIQWCPASALSLRKDENNDGFCNNATVGSEKQLIAIASLAGQVAIYRISIELLELQGVELLYEFQVHSQVRCLALNPLDDGGALLAVGDKGGKINLEILWYSKEENITVDNATNAKIDLDGDSVLGLDVYLPRSILAASTKSGKVLLFCLHSSKDEDGLIDEICHSQVWMQQRNGPVRSIIFGRQGQYVAFGGYDKTLVFVDINLFAVVREVTLRGTVNTITMDPIDRFLVVGCRDKSITFFDTTTYFPVKRFQTPGWVTSISWGNPGIWADIVAVRSENRRISLFDLTPITVTDVSLASGECSIYSSSWSPDGAFLAMIDGDFIRIVDSRRAFSSAAEIEITDSTLSCASFQPKLNTKDSNDNKNEFLLAAAGLDGNLYVLRFRLSSGLIVIHTIFVEKNLWAVSWSKGGEFLAASGKGTLGQKGKVLNIYSIANGLRIEHSRKVDGSIWDIGFEKVDSSSDDELDQASSMAIASGDYTAVVYETENFQPTLEVLRPQTVRCIDYHPCLSLLAMGDGTGTVAIVDYRKEQTVKEFDTGGRVNVVSFSPVGDYLIVGTDKCVFTLHETRDYSIVQEFSREGFAKTASFSPDGKYLSLGSSNEPYGIVRLGPLLGIDLVPLETGTLSLPRWARKETVFRSGFGPSLVQRHMMNGSQDSLQWVADTLRDHPDAIYTRNRLRQEGCFDTALRLRKMKLLQLAVMALVDGSLEATNEGRRSILTTTLPEIGKQTLEAMVEKHPPELIVEIMKHMTFVKVPFTQAHVVSKDRKMFCGSPQYLDPWKKYRFIAVDEDAEGTLSRTAAVLPIPGLGTLSFLSNLVSRVPATVFDNEAMALVLKVMWQHHIQKYFFIDTCIFLLFYVLWILLMEYVSGRSSAMGSAQTREANILGVLILLLNGLFALKELVQVQSNYGKRTGYLSSFSNQVYMVSIILVAVFVALVVIKGREGTWVIPLAVVTTLLLSKKLISYLRAFSETGWLVTVLHQNFKDVKGFLVVLFAMLVGFSTSFRLLFGSNQPSCDVEIDPDSGNLVEDCDENPFGSLRNSVLSTFELTILATYEPSMLYESQHTALAIIVFVTAVTCVLVVALNALISLLADSYTRVQENAAANRRKEKAQLIIEYMSLLPPRRRRKIENETKYFHALLEADADGDLVLDADDWHGGLNALRDDFESSLESTSKAQQEAIENLKKDFEKELSSFREETLALLEQLSEDVKQIKKEQENGLARSTGKNVAKVVKAVGNIQKRSSEFWSSSSN